MSRNIPYRHWQTTSPFFPYRKQKSRETGIKEPVRPDTTNQSESEVRVRVGVRSREPESGVGVGSQQSSRGTPRRQARQRRREDARRNPTTTRKSRLDPAPTARSYTWPWWWVSYMEENWSSTGLLGTVIRHESYQQTATPQFIYRLLMRLLCTANHVPSQMYKCGLVMSLWYICNFSLQLNKSTINTLFLYTQLNKSTRDTWLISRSKKLL